MRRFFMLQTWCFLLLFSFPTFVRAEKDAKPVSVLILGGQNNHNWRLSNPYFEELLDADPDIESTIENSPGRGAKKEDWERWRPNFAKYDCVLLNYNGQMWPEGQRKEFEDYIRGGGTAIVIHAANNAFTGWLEYEKMVALLWRAPNYGYALDVNDADGSIRRVDPGKGRGMGHGGIFDWVMTTRDAKHPITAGMPKRWMHARDELYHGQRGPAKGVNILATAYSDPKHGGTGKHEPIVWWTQYGKGKVVTNVMGHIGDIRCMACVGFQTLVCRSAEWLVRGKASTPIPKDFPTATKTSERKFDLDALKEKAKNPKKPTLASASRTTPNVVFVLADDLGIGDVGCYGKDRCKTETPSLDRLAREGMLFTDAHTAASHCIPARMAIMTGRFPWRFGGVRPSGPWGFLNPRYGKDQFTLAKLMRRAGYTTGYVGKWHLGTLMQTKDGKNQGPKNVDYTKPLEIGPVESGFDESFILPGSLDMYPYVYVRDNEWVGKVTKERGWSAFNRVGPCEENFEDHEVLDTFCREADAFLERRAASKDAKPFFLYVALTSPHTPLSPSEKFRGKSPLGLYGDFVAETDDCYGRVMASLEKHGFAKNTIVIASSDHGAASYAGKQAKATAGALRELEKDGHFASGIYRGYKFSIYEGGLRIPFIVRWPGVVPPGSTSDALVGQIDLARTFAEITGVEIDDAEIPDSVSFLSLLRDKNAKSPRKYLVMQSTGSYTIRENAWKLAICPGSGSGGAFGSEPRRENAWKKAIAAFGRKPNRDEVTAAPFVQLFDLSKDPGETKNLATAHPEIVTRLVRTLEEQSARGRSTPGPKLTNESSGASFRVRVPRFARGW